MPVLPPLPALAMIFRPIADVGDLQYARPRQLAGNGEVPVIRIALLVVLAVHGGGTRRHRAEIDCV